MDRHIYFIVHTFADDTGSYAGFVQEFSKFAADKGYAPVIVCKKSQNNNRQLSYARLVELDTWKITLPIVGLAGEYLLLALSIKNFFKNELMHEEDLIIANGPAALGLRRKSYIMRMGQPAYVFKNNMNIAINHVGFMTRIARTFRYDLIQSFIEKKCERNAAGFMFCSAATRGLNIKKYGCAHIPYIIPYSGVKFDEFDSIQHGRHKTRRMLFIAAGGDERIRKGVMYLEQVLPAVFDMYKDVTLIHLGEKFEWNVPAWCQERIICVGRIPWHQMKDQYANADLLVLASLQEGFPNTIIEAMAAGVPIVSSDIDGIREYVTDGKEGIIFKRGDVEGLRQALLRALVNPAALKRMGQAASKRIRKISYSDYAPQLLSFIKSVKQGQHLSYNLLQDSPIPARKPSSRRAISEVGKA